MIIQEGNKFKLVVEGMDCEEVCSRIEAITSVIQVARIGELSEKNLGILMHMIDEHLPWCNRS